MVLVAVGDDDAAELLLVLQNIGVVGKHQVDTGLGVVGEHETGVDEHHVVAALEDRHVLADAVKAADPTLRFGVSPQGNPDNDRNEQYTDLSVWLTASGADAVVDYLCPQIYWGYGYTLSSGSTRFAFENITAEWLALPRAESTALYFGLGAYRVGVGDGGANADSVSQWCTGSALARQVTDLRSAGAGGWALYRYGSLFRSDESGLAAAERAALTALDG